MIQHTAKIVTIAIGLMVGSTQGEARINQSGVLPPLVCTTDMNFCESTVRIGTLEFVDNGDNGGSIASELTFFVFHVIQFVPPDKPLMTNVVINFDQRNLNYDDPVGVNFLYIRFKDSFGQYIGLANDDIATVALQRSNGDCHLPHQTQAVYLADDIFLKGAATYEITQQTLLDNIHDCG
jgi:hypothetical protein